MPTRPKKQAKRITSNLGPKLCTRPPISPHKAFRIVVKAGQTLRFHEPVDITIKQESLAHVRFLPSHELNGIDSTSSGPLEFSGDDTPLPRESAGGV